MATWDDTFKTNPAVTETPTLGDDRIRENRTENETRMVNEHRTFNSTPASDGARANDWLHLAGSAHVFYQATAPTQYPNGNALDADANGRLWIDSDTDLLYVYIHASWVGVIRETVRFSIQGVLSTGAAVIPHIIFPRAAEILKVSARVVTAPTGADLRIDLEKNGGAATSIFDTNDYVTIADGANAGNSTDMEGTHSILAADEYLSVDIDQVGSTVAGGDLSVSIDVIMV